MNPYDPENELESNQDFDRNFKPRGSLAFFILLILLGMIIWYGIYFLMLDFPDDINLSLEKNHQILSHHLA